MSFLTTWKSHLKRKQISNHPRFLLNLFLAFTYFLVAHFSLLLASFPDQASPVWPSSGLALAAMIQWGYLTWPGIFLGSLLTHFIRHDGGLFTFFVGSIISIGNTLQTLAGAFLIKKIIPSHYLLGSPFRVLEFILIAVFTPLISATLGVITLCLSQTSSWSNAMNTWQTWWTSNIFGILIITPTILVFSSIKLSFSLPFRQIIKLLFFVILTLFLTQLIFLQSTLIGLEFALIPLLLWSVFQFGEFITLLMVVIISIIAILGTIQGLGPFVRPSLDESLFFLQAFIGVISITSLVLSAVIYEREEALLNLFKLNDSYQRFVPQEFLKLLKKNSITEVNLGDQIQKEMTILFADIRDFTSLSEKMSPVDNFKFINDYLELMEPIIMQNNGIIDKYIGDGIMALFSGDPDEAIQAGIEMLKLIKNYNEEQEKLGLSPIKIGIGINTGTLMLGIIGGHKRIESTVISDAVNLASRIEGLTKNYGVSLLISHHTFVSMKNPLNYQVRLIDNVQVKGKSEFVTVYEVFDADPPELCQAKTLTKTIFEIAWILYHLKKFHQAGELFKDCLQQNPHDPVAKIYLKRCQEQPEMIP